MSFQDEPDEPDEPDGPSKSQVLSGPLTLKTLFAAPCSFRPRLDRGEPPHLKLVREKVHWLLEHVEEFHVHLTPQRCKKGSTWQIPLDSCGIVKTVSSRTTERSGQDRSKHQEKRGNNLEQQLIHHTYPTHLQKGFERTILRRLCQLRYLYATRLRSWPNLQVKIVSRPRVLKHPLRQQTLLVSLCLESWKNGAIAQSARCCKKNLVDSKELRSLPCGDRSSVWRTMLSTGPHPRHSRPWRPCNKDIDCCIALQYRAVIISFSDIFPLLFRNQKLCCIEIQYTLQLLQFCDKMMSKNEKFNNKRMEKCIENARQERLLKTEDNDLCWECTTLPHHHRRQSAKQGRLKSFEKTRKTKGQVSSHIGHFSSFKCLVGHVG